MQRRGNRMDMDDPGGWDETVERRSGQAASVVFSVRFSRDEIHQVREAAARLGEKTSEFIRSAALTRSSESILSIDLEPSTSPPPGGVILLFTRQPSSTKSALKEFRPAVVTKS